MNVRESYRRALEQGTLLTLTLFNLLHRIDQIWAADDELQSGQKGHAIGCVNFLLLFTQHSTNPRQNRPTSREPVHRARERGQFTFGLGVSYRRFARQDSLLTSSLKDF